MQNQVWSNLCKNIGTLWTETADVKTISKGTVGGHSYFWEWDRGSERHEGIYFSLYIFHCVLLVLVAHPCPTLCNTVDCSLPGSSVHEDSPGKNTRVGCHALFQGIFPTQGSHPCLLHCRQILHRWATARPSIEQNLELKGCFNLCYCNMIAKFRNLSLGRLYMILSV